MGKEKGEDWEGSWKRTYGIFSICPLQKLEDWQLTENVFVVWSRMQLPLGISSQSTSSSMYSHKCDMLCVF